MEIGRDLCRKSHEAPPRNMAGNVQVVRTIQPICAMNSTLIAAFEKKQSAEDLAGFLQQQNIHATFVDLTVSMPGNALPADFAKYQVRVPEPDAPAAVQATSHTDDGLTLMKPAIRCPE